MARKPNRKVRTAPEDRPPPQQAPLLIPTTALRLKLTMRCWDTVLKWTLPPHVQRILIGRGGPNPEALCQVYGVQAYVNLWGLRRARRVDRAHLIVDRVAETVCCIAMHHRPGASTLDGQQLIVDEPLLYTPGSMLKLENVLCQLRYVM